MSKQSTIRGRHAPARRLEHVRELLMSSGGMSAYDVAEALGVDVRTAKRYLRTLQDMGEPLYDDVDGRRKIWRVLASRRADNVRLTTSQMVALFLSRRVFDFLEGTGFKEDLDDVFERLSASLQRKRFVAVENLDRKLWDVNEVPTRYRGRLDDVDEIITALLKEQRLELRHASVGRGRTRFNFDPYTLLVYQRGLYVAGYSHYHGEVRKLALDNLRQVTWRRKDRFDYPDDYHPSQLVDGAFGLTGGEPHDVRVWFAREAAPFVERAQWHPTQTILRARGGIELHMTVPCNIELELWLLRWGDHAEVLAPASLRERIAGRLRAAAARYD